MDRHWFFTWRTYGTWLPGASGFVGYFRNPERVIANQPNEPTADAIPLLEKYASDVMKGETVVLSILHAEVLLRQFHETATCRGWNIDAVAVMSNHIHIVFGVLDDPEPSELLKTWKSYASRALNRQFTIPNSPRWFSDGGSKRFLKGEANLLGAIRYVRDQNDPLLVWLSSTAADLAKTHTPEVTQATDVAGSPGGFTA